MLLNWTKNLLRKHGIKPNKHFGQNFLIDTGAMRKLISACDISKDGIVLEVGAGVGTITLELAKLAKKVIAVEKDAALVPILEKTIRGYKNVKIIHGNILNLPYTLYPIPYTLVSNIPYYLTAPLIRKFLESENPPESMTLMVQKEMAQRISAKPPDMSILAVSVQVYAKPEIISYVPRSSFWPQPKVDSAIIKVLPYSHDRGFNAQKFFPLVRAGFKSPRKQLVNNLSGGLDMDREQARQWLVSCGIAPERRAETLRVEDWLLLAKLSP